MSVHRNSVSVLVLGTPVVIAPYYAFWRYLAPVAAYVCNQPAEVDVHLYISGGKRGNLRITPKRIEEWFRTAWRSPHSVTVHVIRDTKWLPDILLQFAEARCRDEHDFHPPVIFCSKNSAPSVWLMSREYFDHFLMRGICRDESVPSRAHGLLSRIAQFATEAFALYFPPFDAWRRSRRIRPTRDS